MGQPSLRAVIAAGGRKECRNQSHAFKQAMRKWRFRMNDTIELPFRCYSFPRPSTVECKSKLFSAVMRICKDGSAYQRVDA